MQYTLPKLSEKIEKRHQSYAAIYARNSTHHGSTNPGSNLKILEPIYPNSIPR